MSSFLFKTALFLILSTLGVLTFSWAITLIWGWYIVPAFHVAALKYKTALGLSYLGQMMTVKVPKNQLKTTPVWLTPLFSIFFGLVFALFGGFWFLVLP